MSRQWQKSSSGPDWTDIRSVMINTCKLHECQCYIEMFPDGVAYGGSLRVVVTYVSNRPGSDLKSCEESVSGQWPNINNGSMEGMVYSLLIAGDSVLSAKWWKNEVLQLP